MGDVEDHERLIYVHFEITPGAAESHGDVIRHHLHCDHGRASHCVGLIFPGMIEEPGSFSGIRSSAKPARGPQAYQRASLPIFIRAPARVRSAALTSTIASWADSAAHLFGAATNALPVSSAILRAATSPNRGWAFRPVPTAVPPMASAQTSGSVRPTPCSA